MKSLGGLEKRITRTWLGPKLYHQKGLNSFGTYLKSMKTSCDFLKLFKVLQTWLFRDSAFAFLSF